MVQSIVLVLFSGFLGLLGLGLFSAACIIAPRDKKQLLLVQAVVRHGDRAAQDQFATEESAKVFFRGLGQMSDDGIKNANKHSADFRQRYVNEFKFIDERYLPSEVEIHSNSAQRVLMSAGSFGNGLFYKTSDGNVVAPPIFTNKTDPVLSAQLNCLDYWDDAMAYLNLTSSENIKNVALDVMEQTMWPASCKDVPADKVDAIISELPNSDIHMPDAYVDCAKLPAKQFMYDYISLMGGSGDHYNEMRLKRTAGLLTNELLMNMNDWQKCGLNCTSLKKFRVFYTHDINVLALSHVFQSIEAYNKITPAFSSTLVFELWWSEQNGYLVNTYLKDGHDASFVPVGPNLGVSTLEAVNRFAGAYAITEPVSCKVE